MLRLQICEAVAAVELELAEPERRSIEVTPGVYGISHIVIPSYTSFSLGVYREAKNEPHGSRTD